MQTFRFFIFKMACGTALTMIRAAGNKKDFVLKIWKKTTFIAYSRDLCPRRTNRFNLLHQTVKIILRSEAR